MAPFKRKTLGRIVSFAAISVVYLTSDKIIFFLRDLISSIGLSTRIMDYYMMGMFDDTSGRDDIQKSVINSLSFNSFGGLGIGGDWRVAGVYSHNIILEFLASFGVIVGSLLLGLLLICYVRGLLHCRTIGQKEMWLIFVVCGFVRLLLSGTFVTEPFFYLFIGYCVAMNKNNLSREKHVGQ
jgi:hypothetical protein